MHLPFTSEQFLNVFKTYNEAIFPIQLIFSMVALFIVFMLFRKTIVKDKFISYILSFFWLWMGIVYQIIYFSEINKAAYVFGVLFIVQGIIFFTYARVPYKMSYQFDKSIYNYAGLLFILYALLIYPVVGYFLGHHYPHSPTFGAPCPTTIFTFGVLLFVRNKIPVWAMIIPLLWSIIGFGAAISLSIYEDIGLLIAGLASFSLIIMRNREISIGPA